MAENIFKRLSLVPAGLRYKLMIVFCLMSIIPLLICVYIAFNFVFPRSISDIGPLSLVIFITLVIAVLGFILARRMIEPIIDMALEAKLIAGGDFERSIKVSEEGEIGDLAQSLNFMTDKIRNNIADLKSYGEKTREINNEIHKKVMVLSGLLQVGNLIAGGTELKAVMEILVEKVSLLDGPSPTALMLIDEEGDNLIPFSNVNFINAELAKMPLSLRYGLLARLRADAKDIIIDKRIKEEDTAIRNFRQLYEVKNAIILPILTRGKLEGAIFSGNNEEGFEYTKDDIDLLHVFCKQAAIAVENDHLFKKTEELEVKDDLTQLFNEKFIRQYLEDEIKRAIVYQRPCSFILFSIDNFKEFCNKHGRVAGEAALKRIARLIFSELSPVDRAARFSEDEFCFVLPERNKKEAMSIADEIRKKISELVVFPEAKAEEERHLTVSGSLSENPIDGVSAKELIDKARELLKEAKAAGKNIIKG